MLRLDRIELVNYCQHAHLVADVARGLTAIVGPNGSGKSNLLGAVCGALTGRFMVSAGAKTDNVCSLASADARSYVRLLVSPAEGVTAELTRSLRPASQALKIDGRKTLTRTAEIEEEVAAWLGMPSTVFTDFAFAHQWSIFAVVDMSPGDRAKAMGRLFRLDDAARCWALVGDHLRELQEPVLPYDADEVTTRLAAQEKRAAEVEKTLFALPAADPGALERLHARVAAQTRLAALRKERSVLQERRVTLQTKRDDVSAILDAVVFDWNVLNDDDEFCAEQVDGWRRSLDVWKARKSAVGKLSLLGKQLATHKAQPRPAPPAAPEGGWQVPEDDDALAQVAADCARLAAFIATAEEGLPECPTCGQATTALLSQLDVYRAELDRSTRAAQALKQRRQAARAHKDALAAHAQRERTWANQVDALERQKAALEGALPAEPMLAEVVLQQRLAEAEEIRHALQKLVADQRRLEPLLARAEADLTSADERLEQLDRGLEDLDGAEADDGLQAALVQLNAQAETRKNLELEAVFLAERIAESRRLQEESASVLAERARMKSWRVTLEKVRDALHRDALPRLVAQAHLRQLEEGVNRFLEDLGVDFRARVGEELDFHVYFPDGRAHPAARLSGGEKVVFALAWRLAVHANFAADVGLLCLDEPTAGLDGERLDCVRRALERLRDLSGDRGLQCVIVTHERSLMPFFDHVIEIQPTS